jgi:hypothetical protein
MSFLKLPALIVVAILISCALCCAQEREFLTECDAINYFLNDSEVNAFIRKHSYNYNFLTRSRYSDTATLVMMDADSALTNCGITSWGNNKLTLVTTGDIAEQIKTLGLFYIPSGIRFVFIKTIDKAGLSLYFLTHGNDGPVAGMTICHENNKYQLHKKIGMGFY